MPTSKGGFPVLPPLILCRWTLSGRAGNGQCAVSAEGCRLFTGALCLRQQRETLQTEILI